MDRGFPTGPLIATVVCVAIVNVVAAQAIVSMVGGGDGFRLGPAVTVLLIVVAVVSAIMAVRGWRSYLGEQRRAAGRDSSHAESPAESE